MPKRVRLIRDHMRPDRPTTGTIEVWDGPIRTLTIKSLELPWLDNGPRKSCIPIGTYTMRWTTSPKFGATWQVMDVPNRTAIRIHAANYTRQLLGCIAPGLAHMDIAREAAIDATSSRRGLEMLEACLLTEAQSGTPVTLGVEVR